MLGFIAQHAQNDVEVAAFDKWGVLIADDGHLGKAQCDTIARQGAAVAGLFDGGHDLSAGLFIDRGMVIENARDGCARHPAHLG